MEILPVLRVKQQVCVPCGCSGFLNSMMSWVTGWFVSDEDNDGTDSLTQAGFTYLFPRSILIYWSRLWHSVFFENFGQLCRFARAMLALSSKCQWQTEPLNTLSSWTVKFSATCRNWCCSRSEIAFQAIGPATEKARQPNMLRCNTAWTTVNSNGTRLSMTSDV